MPSHSVRQLMEQKMGTFGHFVIFVLLEWMLILLLFIDGILAFLSNEFAKYFDLRIPCLLCTRIDHVFVHRNPDFYCNETICESHKKSISRMAYCHVHKKLSDIREMCEGCLLSFATEKDADCDTYKSLVGILNKDLECFVEDDSKIHLKFPGAVRREDDIVEVDKGSPELFCSCCGDPLKVKLTVPKGNVSAVSNKVKQLCTAPTPTPRSPQVLSKNEEISNALTSDAKFPAQNDLERMNEDQRTPIFARGNKYFGIALSDSPTASPRWTSRIYKKSPLEKTEYAAEISDGNVANYEIDGESILHRLKRQVRLDRKSLIELYMELDEERSASTEAANNAMAMITRLQAEKAAVQMEALQYQRMMEEQAEYDQEALQVMKELLDKRDDEFKTLEFELEAYREKFGVIDLPLRDIDEYDEDNENDSDGQKLNTESNNTDRPKNVRNLSHLDLENERRALLKQTERLKSLLQLMDPDEAVNLIGSSSDRVDQENGNETSGGSESAEALAKEVYCITQRLQALEEESKFLKQATELETLDKNEEGVTELSETETLDKNEEGGTEISETGSPKFEEA